MTKTELIERVFKDNRPRRISRVAIREMITVMLEIMLLGVTRDGKFSYPGFGSFILKKRKARKGRSPVDGSPIDIKAHTTITFRAAPKFKQKLL